MAEKFKRALDLVLSQAVTDGKLHLSGAVIVDRHGNVSVYCTLIADFDINCSISTTVLSALYLQKATMPENHLPQIQWCGLPLAPSW